MADALGPALGEGQASTANAGEQAAASELAQPSAPQGQAIGGEEEARGGKESELAQQGSEDPDQGQAIAGVEEAGGESNEAQQQQQPRAASTAPVTAKTRRRSQFSPPRIRSQRLSILQGQMRHKKHAAPLRSAAVTPKDKEQKKLLQRLATLQRLIESIWTDATKTKARKEAVNQLIDLCIPASFALGKQDALDTFLLLKPDAFPADEAEWMSP